MMGLRKKNLWIPVATLVVILLGKFLYLDKQAVQSQTTAEQQNEHQYKRVPTPPTRVSGAAPTVVVLTSEEVDRILKEDEEHANYLTMEFGARKLLRKKTLDTNAYANVYLLEGGGELTHIFTNNVMTQESWVAADGDSIERSLTHEGKIYALSVREKSYGYTNFYDANMQITKKVEKRKGDISCVKYDSSARPVTRELGVCGDEDNREFEDQFDDPRTSP